MTRSANSLQCGRHGKSAFTWRFASSPWPSVAERPQDSYVGRGACAQRALARVHLRHAHALVMLWPPLLLILYRIIGGIVAIMSYHITD